MEEAILYISLSLLLISFALKLYSSRIYKKNLPPGPPSLPVLGHLHLLKTPFTIHRTLHNLAQKYGPIISLRFGSKPVIIVSSLAAAQECFTKNDIVLANRPKLILGKHLGYNYTTLTLSPYGDHWRNLRRIGVIEIFSTHRINMFMGIRKDEIKRLIRKLSRDSLGDFSKVELKSVFRELTFNNMMRMVAGERYYGDDVNDEEAAKQFRETMREAVTYAGVSNPGDFLPILNWIGGGGYEKKVIRLAKKVDKFLQGLIDEHRKKREGLESKNTMIDHLLSLQESQPEYYTDEIIKGLILIVLLAGTDTTAVTLEWAMSNLLNHPSTMKKAREELNNQVGQDSLLDESHLPKLAYLGNIVSETLRLYPAAPLLVPHVASDDCSIGGYRVPQGTMVLVNAWAIHRDPNLWDDPTKFKPERFDNGGGESLNKFMPFGLGRRSCPGSTLAQRVVSFTLGSLIQCFEWKRVTDEEVDMTEGRGITLQKVQPLEAMCKASLIVNKI